MLDTHHVTYEWVGPVCVGVVGALGVGSTFWTGKQGRDHVERIENRRFIHDELMAHEARDQERLSEAYVKLLMMVEASGTWAQTVKPMIDTEPPGWVPPLPELQTQHEAESLMNAYGSDEVVALFDDWRSTVFDVIKNVQLIDMEKAERAQGGHGIDFGQPYRALLDLRPVERGRRAALVNQVKAELRTARPHVQG